MVSIPLVLSHSDHINVNLKKCKENKFYMAQLKARSFTNINIIFKLYSLKI